MTCQTSSLLTQLLFYSTLLMARLTNTPSDVILRVLYTLEVDDILCLERVRYVADDELSDQIHAICLTIRRVPTYATSSRRAISDSSS